MELIHMKYQASQRQLILHIVLFFILWAVYESVVVPFIKGYSVVLFNILNPIIKLLVWTLPVLLSLKYEGKNILSYLKLKGSIKNPLKWGFVVSVLNIGYNLLMNNLFYGNISYNPFFDINKWIGGVILIGFTEEIFFRGYLLQRIGNYFSLSLANIIASLLFLSIHFPIWYVHRAEVANGLIEWLCLIAFVFGFSIIQGYIFKNSNSLWPCIMMHSVNNFMANAMVVGKLYN